MRIYAKNPAVMPELPASGRRSVWNVVVKVLAAALAALAGALTGTAMSA